MTRKRHFRIFSTEKGINVIESPVKSMILSELKDRDMKFQEIVELTGRSKSTVSKHLSDLKAAGLLVEKKDPKDQRKKIFRINSRYLGKLTKKPAYNLFEDKNDALAGSITAWGDPLEFFSLMFHALRLELIKEGINIDPILRDAGMKIGDMIYPKIESEDLLILLEELKKFWERNHLGIIEVGGLDPLLLRVRDCFECSRLPPIGESACAFDSGILRAVFERYFNARVLVEETECYALGDERCSFRIIRAE